MTQQKNKVGVLRFRGTQSALAGRPAVDPRIGLAGTEPRQTVASIATKAIYVLQYLHGITTEKSK